MQYAFYDLGVQRKGSTAVITLSAATNVQLLDQANLDLLRHNVEYKAAIGQYVYMSPHRMTIPESGHWYVAIENPTAMQHSVKVLPPKL